MYPIYAFSAAPHFPHVEKDKISVSRPENLANVLTFAALGNGNVQILERNGEIYIELLAA